MKILPIHLSTTYSIFFENDCLHANIFIEFCAQVKKRLVIITDHHLVNSHGKNLLKTLQQQNLAVDLLSFPAGEIHKTRETKQQLEDELLAKKYGRDTCLIALGGGVVTDMVGFIAATYCRGIPVIYIPTSLLAMVDASIGGKTGVNTPHGKNLIGSFSQPLAVFIDPTLLHSLPEKEWNNGIVEMIKHGMIADSTLFTSLKENILKLKQRDPHFLLDVIYTSCVIKKNIVEQDETEQNIRQLLNFGHTIGHAIETSENYRLSHGEAVAIGMLVESYLSIQNGNFSLDDLNELLHVLRAYDLPLKTSAFQDKPFFKKILMRDKKALENIPRFVLLDKIGKPYYGDGQYTQIIHPEALDHALDWARIF